MKIIGLDLGTSCGWASSEGASGVWNMSGNKSEGGGMRFIRFRRHMTDLCLRATLVAFEDVRRHGKMNGTHSAHIYGGFKSHLMEWCEANSVPYVGITPAEIKKHATGKDNASKDDMVKAAKELWPTTFTSGDDNEADAIWIMECAKARWME